MAEMLRDWVQTVVSRSHLPWRLRYLVSIMLLKRLMPVGQVVDGYVGAYRMSLDLRDQIQREIYLGFYEPIHIRLMTMSYVLKLGDVFFDVGANVGYYSLLASQLVGKLGHVHAFEPIAGNVAVLEQAFR